MTWRSCTASTRIHCPAIILCSCFATSSWCRTTFSPTFHLFLAQLQDAIAILMVVVEEDWDGVDTCALGALSQNEGFACDPLSLSAARQSCSPVQHASRALAERCRWPPVDTLPAECGSRGAGNRVIGYPDVLLSSDWLTPCRMPKLRLIRHLAHLCRRL